MPSLTWVALGLVAAAGGAGVALLGKLGLGDVDPTLATTLRSIVMTAVLVGVCVTTGRFRDLLNPSSTVGGRALTWIVLAGLAGAISWLAYFAALRLGAAAQVAAIDRLSLVIVVLLSATLLGERYGWRGWVGLVLVVSGVTLMASDPTPATAGSAGETVEAPAGPD